MATNQSFKTLRSDLESSIDPSRISIGSIIFLGDLRDRGPDTKSVIDFCSISPPSTQTGPMLCGNHDLAFSAFVGVLPPPCDGSEFRET
ncbi:hypothetical protein Syun_007487 [Stephania yunnanensis]|uniref:Calcineurin-like phosphoesterase domain-containing protein n=1 Tax=Stephania yunnanensis TaxID=152371 RepID=A0AAP0KYU4_9MAGN